MRGFVSLFLPYSQFHSNRYYSQTRRSNKLHIVFQCEARIYWGAILTVNEGIRTIAS